MDGRRCREAPRRAGFYCRIGLLPLRSLETAKRRKPSHLLPTWPLERGGAERIAGRSRGQALLGAIRRRRQVSRATVQAKGSAVKITVELTAEQWAEILWAASGFRDDGPDGEGWQSNELKAAVRALADELSKKR